MTKKDKIKSFYDDMATQYDMLFQDWLKTTKIQAKILDKIFKSYDFNESAKLLDCACGIGTQAIGLAMLGYNVTMDNALPHMLSKENLHCAIESISNQTDKGGIFVASIRDYDELLKQKPQCSTPYIYKTDKGQKVSFQAWEWLNENYKFTQYIIDDENSVSISKFDCEYRAVKREELTEHLLSCGFTKVEWKFPEETQFYQPIVIAIK